LETGISGGIISTFRIITHCILGKITMTKKPFIQPPLPPELDFSLIFSDIIRA
jgi:hypothetical protein